MKLTKFVNIAQGKRKSEERLRDKLEYMANDTDKAHFTKKAIGRERRPRRVCVFGRIGRELNDCSGISYCLLGWRG